MELQEPCSGYCEQNRSWGGGFGWGLIKWPSRQLGTPKRQLGAQGAQFGAHGAKLGVLETKLGALGTEMGCMVLWEPTFGSGS